MSALTGMLSGDREHTSRLGFVPPAYHIAEASQDKGVIGVVTRSSFAVIVAVGGLTTTNPALSYNFHYETGLTNRMVSLPGQESDWIDEEDAMLASFLGYLSEQMAADPGLVVPADEDQLERIKALVAGVKV